VPFDDHPPAPRPGPHSGGHQPAINLPPVTLWLIIINVVIHGLRLLLPDATDNALLEALAFVPLRYSESATAAGGSELGTWLSPLGYQFLHVGWLHLLVNCATLAAFGAPVERLLGPRRFLVFYLVCGVIAAAGHFLVNMESTSAMIGASGGISGLFGAIVTVIGLQRGWRWIVPIIVLMVVLQVGVGWLGLPGADGDIAWEAHIAGFIAGLILIRLFGRRRT
jgi:membrane associated rhomboid family serine protease